MNYRLELEEEPTESRKMSKQAEREAESKKLAMLMERVKRQLATIRNAPPPRAA
jgi:hypothetical protein